GTTSPTGWRRTSAAPCSPRRTPFLRCRACIAPPVASAAGSHSKGAITMSDASFASLNSSLLARKGGARPAMRPQSALIAGHAAVLPDNIEDLGWNDMGADEEPAREAEVLQLTPFPSN